MATKVYWVELKRLIDELCRYYARWKNKLPNDLPAAVTAVLFLIDAACLAMEVYDKTHPHGGAEDD